MTLLIRSWLNFLFVWEYWQCFLFYERKIYRLQMLYYFWHYKKLCTWSVESICVWHKIIMQVFMFTWNTYFFSKSGLFLWVVFQRSYLQYHRSIWYPTLCVQFRKKKISSVSMPSIELKLISDVYFFSEGI